MRNLFILFAAAGLMVGPAAAQKPAPNWTEGAAVTDPSGGAVGTIAKVEGEFVILKTAKHEVRLPKSSFTARGAGLAMSMTQAEVDAAVEKKLADPSSRPAAAAPAEAAAPPAEEQPAAADED